MFVLSLRGSTQKQGVRICNPPNGKFSQMLDSAEAPRNRTGSHGGIGGVRKVCPRQIAERTWTMFFFLLLLTL
jgi:hypothetical protein